MLMMLMDTSFHVHVVGVVLATIMSLAVLAHVVVLIEPS
jgi:hypothetical protein